MKDWLKEAYSIGDRIRGIRHYLHMHPELGNHEKETSEYIASCLREYGLRVERLLESAVIGELDTGVAGPTIALRSDIDALPITEDTGYAFSSVNEGVMHACGHDVHMSAALGTALLLCSHRDALKGRIKFIFQPDEEGRGGAKRLVDLGVMDGVDAVFGMHVTPDLAFGEIGIRYGKFYAASDNFSVRVLGLSAHGAEPEKGRDALYSAALMVAALHELPLEVLSSPAIVTTGILRAGRADNVIADDAYFEGIIRTLGPEDRAYVRRRFNEIVENIARKQKVSAKVTLTESYPGVVNSIDTTAVAEKAATELFGEGRVTVIDKPLMVTDDFGYFVDASQGTYYHLGVGGDAPLHNPHFLAPEDAPLLGAALHAAVIVSSLSMIPVSRGSDSTSGSA